MRNFRCHFKECVKLLVFDFNKPIFDLQQNKFFKADILW